MWTDPNQLELARFLTWLHNYISHIQYKSHSFPTMIIFSLQCSNQSLLFAICFAMRSTFNCPTDRLAPILENFLSFHHHLILVTFIIPLLIEYLMSHITQVFTILSNILTLIVPIPITSHSTLIISQSNINFI